MNSQSNNYLSNKLIAEYLYHYPSEGSFDLEVQSSEDIINLINTIPIEKCSGAIRNLPKDILINIFSKSDSVTHKKIINLLTAEHLSEIIYGLEDELKEEILSVIPAQLKKEIKEIQKYPEDTAGYIMDHKVLSFYPEMTVQEALKKIKSKNRKGIRLVYITTHDGNLHSYISIQQLIMAEETARLSDISQSIPGYVTALAPKEEIMEKIETLKLTDIPVVDVNNCFIGIVSHKTVIQVAQEELTKNIQKMVGVSEDEKALSKVLFSVRKRLPWLQVNLLTAFLAAAVVGFFESTIAQFTALAVLLPVVAGQSGNTGAQALAVTMRGLALKEIRTSHWLKLILKELKVSLITGAAVAATTALGVFIWSGSYGLMLIIAISMIVSMVLASMSGAAVPLILARLGQDPAASSSILLTTVTDIAGFFSFLGIATLLSKII